jgi:hypothetical protein
MRQISTHPPVAICRECMLCFHSYLARSNEHHSTEASPRTSPAEHALYGCTWFLVGLALRLRVTGNSALLLFLLRRFSLLNASLRLRQPFSLSAKTSFSPHTAQCKYYIGPGSQPTLRGPRPLTGSEISPSCRAMEIVAHSNDHTLPINGWRLFLLDTIPHLNVMKPSQFFSFDQTRGPFIRTFF